MLLLSLITIVKSEAALSGIAVTQVCHIHEAILTSICCCRQCATALCAVLESSLHPVAEMLTKHVQPEHCRVAQSCTDVQQLQTLIQASSDSCFTQHTQNITAVLYCFAVAAPAHLQPSLSSRSVSVNQLISSLALLLSSKNISIDSSQVWQDWQLLLGAVGLHSCHICPLLTPASKAIILCLQAAASSPVLSIKLQARLHASIPACP